MTMPSRYQSRHGPAIDPDAVDNDAALKQRVIRTPANKTRIERPPGAVTSAFDLGQPSASAKLQAPADDARHVLALLLTQAAQMLGEQSSVLRNSWTVNGGEWPTDRYSQYAKKDYEAMVDCASQLLQEVAKLRAS